MSPQEAPFDPGLQSERTLLAWRRTALALAVASAVAARLSIGQLGAVAVVAGLCGFLLSAAAYLGANLRYRRAHASLTAGKELTLGGWALAAVAGAMVLVAAMALGYLFR